MPTTPSSEEVAKALDDHLRKALHGGTEKKKESKPKKKPKLFSEGSFDQFKGENMLSSVFGIDLPEGLQDLPVTVFKQTNWNKTIRSHIPKPDSRYVFQVEKLYDIMIAFELGEKCWLTGPTGAGKSSLIKEICARTNRPFIRVNGRGDLESAQIFGQYVVEDGSTKWRDGAFTEAVRHGAVFLQDEPTVIPAEISMGYQWILEDEGKLFLIDKAGSVDEKMITPHSEFRFVCADNTRGLGDERGDFAGTSVWNTATLDRFSTTVNIDYLSKEEEISILQKAYPKLTSDLASKMLQLAYLVRSAYDKQEISLTMSPRTLLSWTRKALVYKDVKRSFRVAFYEKLPSESERHAVNGMFETVFDEAL